MNTFTLVFLSLLTAVLATRLWLNRRHLAFVARHREAVPEAFQGRIALKEHQKAADYTRAKVALAQWDLVADVIILLLWTLGGTLALMDQAWRSLGLSELLTGVAMLISLFVVSMLLDLPFNAWRTFVIEERFGFNRTRPMLFLSDQLKQLLLLLLLGAPLAAGILWILANAGAYWWVYAWALWFGFSLVMAWAYPVIIAPLFNRFEPLDDDEVRTRVAQLLERNGLGIDGIFVMDGSRRSGHGNAYFTGFGANKRIVFFDTLLEKLGAQEIEAVLAHEIGHYKHRHVAKRIALMGVTSLAGLGLVGWLMQQPWFYGGLGVDVPSGYMAIILFVLIAPVFTFFLNPLGSWYSRRHEFEADAFAVGQSDAKTLAGALVKLYQENASTLTPDPLYSAFYDSHPPAPVRVARLEAASAALA